jgi:hypothetical protein
MAEKPKTTEILRDFPGLMSRPDASDLPPGAAHLQINLQSAREGILESRPGLGPVTFEEE